MSVSEIPNARALYLRWRPTRFAEVVGQAHVTRTLRNAVRTGHVAHAYLFCGPRGTGKTSVARILFKALNCQRALDGEPCGRCPLCEDAAAGRAVDLVEIDAASNRGIDDIREIRERVRFAPGEARYKLYIIDEAHQLTQAAWDAFLKTLEEPPAHAKFVLCTTEVHKVPATIVSRCQRLDFARITLADLVARLRQVAESEGLRVDSAVLERVARSARGGLRDALSLLDQLVAFAGPEVSMEAARQVLGLAATEAVRGFVEALARRDPSDALAIVNTLIEEGVDLRQLLDDALTYLRALLVVRVGAGQVLETEFTREEVAWLAEVAERWTPGQLLRLARLFGSVDARVRDASQLQFQIEMTCVDACLDPADEHASEVRRAALGPDLGGRRSLTQRAPRSTGPSPGPPSAHREGRPPTSGVEATGAWTPPSPMESEAASAVDAATPDRAVSPAESGEEIDVAGHEPPSAGVSPDGPTGNGGDPGQGVSTSADVERPDSLSAAPPAVAVDAGSPTALAEPEGTSTVWTLEQLQARWATLLEELAERAPSVRFALPDARLLRVERQTIVLGFRTPFHRKTASRPENQRDLERALGELLGHPFRVRCTDLEERPEDDVVLAEALRLFNARLMEE
ncbi:MAG TPA: DNA polymerase III subunit gamma/tau [Chloroflexota bacterium]